MGSRQCTFECEGTCPKGHAFFYKYHEPSADCELCKNHAQMDKEAADLKKIHENKMLAAVRMCVRSLTMVFRNVR